MNKTALLFPGQGSQYVGMGKRLHQQFECARLVFEEAGDILNYDIAKLCFEGDLEKLTQTNNTQPAIFTVSVAAYRAYMEQLAIEPHCAAGHSLGEFSALCCSGAIAFSDALKIVQKRGALMHQASEQGHGAMAAIGGLEAKLIEDTCLKVSDNNAVAGIACYNSPEQIVISGHSEAVTKAGELLKSMEAQVNYLKVGAAFHSSLMTTAADGLKEELQNYQYDMPKYKVISNFNGLPYTNTLDIIENLTLQMYKPVQWQASMKQLYSQGARIFVEIGPSTVLRNLTGRNLKHASAFSFDKDEDISALTKLTNTKDKVIKHNLIDHCLAVAVSTKNYNYEEEEYKRDVINNYRILEDIQKQLVNQNNVPTEEQMLKSVKLLKDILKAKLLSEEEQLLRIKYILEETQMSSLYSHIL